MAYDLRLRATAVLGLTVLILITSAQPAIAQDPSTELPAGALKRTVLDLRYAVIDLKMGASDTGGRGSKLAGKVEALAIKETPTEIRLELAADVLFDFDKADIKPEAASAMKKAAAVLREKAKGPVRVEGHTDAKGSDAYNQRLSLQRAESVRAWLVGKEGLSALRFQTQGFGAKRPVAPNTKPDGSDDPAGRQKNRRVEIIASKVG